MSDSRERLGRVIAAFPATGKTFVASRDRRFMDSDSSQLSWSAPGVRHPDWPSNYIAHIREGLASGARVLVSTHSEVRSALVDAGLPFTLVYPEATLRDEYRARMVDRGSPPGLIRKVIDELWDDALAGCAAQAGCEHVVLGEGRYLADVLRTTEGVSDEEHGENIELALWRREWEQAGRTVHSCIQNAIALTKTDRDACSVCGAVIDL